MSCQGKGITFEFTIKAWAHKKNSLVGFLSCYIKKCFVMNPQLLMACCHTIRGKNETPLG